MNGFEIVCFIVGIVLLLGYNWTPKDKTSLKLVVIQNFITMTIASCLILLPLYFNYWRR